MTKKVVILHGQKIVKLVSFHIQIPTYLNSTTMGDDSAQYEIKNSRSHVCINMMIFFCIISFLKCRSCIYYYHHIMCIYESTLYSIFVGGIEIPLPTIGPLIQFLVYSLIFSRRTALFCVNKFHIVYNLQYFPRPLFWYTI